MRDNRSLLGLAPLALLGVFVAFNLVSRDLQGVHLALHVLVVAAIAGLVGWVLGIYFGVVLGKRGDVIGGRWVSNAELNQPAGDLDGRTMTVGEHLERARRSSETVS